MTDNRDYIDRTLSRTNNYLGREASPDELATEFAKMDIDARVDTLEAIQADDRELTPRELGKRLGYMRALLGTHERLRKAGR
ncbi:hypothetical protein ABH973_006240 [Bradyrhizobium ottawaense]|uniref:hypothetical protein n=1 Tax=Bradyrhizobium ottawaense TaxID=931866 RepID=UPI0035143F81